MRLFRCETCGQTLHFGNTACVRCGARLGFDTSDMLLHALVPVEEELWEVSGRPGRRVRFCHNAAIDVCNWLIPAESSHAFCGTCIHNRIVPMTDPVGLERWRRIGAAQHHLFYSLLRWNLPHPTREEAPETGLVFDILADEVDQNGNIVPAMTGHEDGLISLRAAEADDAVREAVRVAMQEPYRSLLGHLRHEVGHFYWGQLVTSEETSPGRARSSATSGRTMRPPSSGTIGTDRRPTGSSASSVPTPAPIRRRISPNAGRTISISSTRSRRPARSASTSIREAAMTNWKGTSASIPIAPRAPKSWSMPGCRSVSPSTRSSARWASRTATPSSCPPRWSRSSSSSGVWSHARVNSNRQ